MPSYCSFQPSLLVMRDVIVGGRDRQQRPQRHGQYSASYNEAFKAFHPQSQSRKLFRAGDEFTPVAQHKFVARGKKSDCVACQGHRVGQPRSRSSRRPLASVSSNKKGLRRRQSTKGCEQCDVALCNSKYCWDIYHRLI